MVHTCMFADTDRRCPVWRKSIQAIMDHSAVQRAIDAAIERGAPAYNAGDAAACYKVYCTCAEQIVSQVKDQATAELLITGLRKAQACRTPDDKAWAMRDVLDKLCVCLIIRVAISKGAPLFNAGQQMQCFELYAKAAKECAGTGRAAPPGLEAALMEARATRDDSEAAWVLREALPAQPAALDEKLHDKEHTGEEDRPRMVREDQGRPARAGDGHLTCTTKSTKEKRRVPSTLASTMNVSASASKMCSSRCSLDILDCIASRLVSATCLYAKQHR